MSKSIPFFRLSSSTQKTILYVLGISGVFLLLVLNILDRPLKTASAPMGIVSYELAGEFTQTQAILDSWDHSAKLSAALSLGIDYFFLVIYSLFLALVCFKIAGSLAAGKEWIGRMGVFLGWMQLLAGFFDALENYTLIRLLFGSENQLFSSLAFYFASMKFFIISLGFIYIIFGLIYSKTSPLTSH